MVGGRKPCQRFLGLWPLASQANIADLAQTSRLRRTSNSLHSIRLARRGASDKCAHARFCVFISACHVARRRRTLINSSPHVAQRGAHRDRSAAGLLELSIARARKRAWARVGVRSAVARSWLGARSAVPIEHLRISLRCLILAMHSSTRAASKQHPSKLNHLLSLRGDPLRREGSRDT